LRKKQKTKLLEAPQFGLMEFGVVFFMYYFQLNLPLTSLLQIRVHSKINSISSRYENMTEFCDESCDGVVTLCI